jgi:hypothetical protein
VINYTTLIVALFEKLDNIRDITRFTEDEHPSSSSSSTSSTTPAGGRQSTTRRPKVFWGKIVKKNWKN